jgi:hypothetical protein
MFFLIFGAFVVFFSIGTFVAGAFAVGAFVVGAFLVDYHEALLYYFNL